MYFKIALLLVSVVLVSAETDCDCSDPKMEKAFRETNDIVQFLIKLSKTAVTDDEKYPAVLPGSITGSLGCLPVCSENLRKKRKIAPNEGIPLIDKPRTEDDEILPPSVRLSNRNCPVEYIRIGKTCIHKNDMLY